MLGPTAVVFFDIRMSIFQNPDMQTTIRMNRELYRQLKELAAAESTSVTRLIELACADLLRARRSAGRRRRLKPLPTVDLGSFRHGIDPSSNESIYAAEEGHAHLRCERDPGGMQQGASRSRGRRRIAG
jgi:hypothetical protein